MAVTLKELADMVGLERSTVAYALSGKGTISARTRAAVLSKAAEVGYMPNRMARRLRSRQTKLVGLVVPDVFGAYNEIVQETFRTLTGQGYDVEIALTEFSPELEERAIRSLLESRVDGIILKTLYAKWSDVPAEASLRQLKELGTPVVCLDYAPEESGLSCFQLPSREIGKMATEHLLSQGRRRIGWLLPTQAPWGARIYLDRIAGSMDALRLAGQDPSQLQVYMLGREDAPRPKPDEGEGSSSYIRESLPGKGIHRGRVLFRAAMAAAERPDAVICYNDVVAIGAMLEAQQMGVRVPEDVAVAANSYTAASDLAPLSLTTVIMPTHDVVSHTLDLLFDTIHHTSDGAGKTVTVPPHLVIGRSTASKAGTNSVQESLRAQRAVIPNSLR